MANATEGDKDKKTESPPANPAGRTNLLLMVIAIVLGLLLIGLTVVATVMITTRTGGHAPAQEQHADAAAAGEGEGGEKADKADAAKAKTKEAAEDKKKKDEPKAPAIYVTLEPPFVVNFPPGKPAKFLQITMEIMTRNQAISQLLKDNNPLLRNDLIMLFGSQEYEAIVAPGGKENLRTLALEATRGVVKKEGGKPAEVEAVYFTSVVMQ